MSDPTKEELLARIAELEKQSVDKMEGPAPSCNNVG